MAVIVWAVSVLLFPVLAGAGALVLFGGRRRRTGPIGLLLHVLSRTNAAHCSYYSPDKFAALLKRLTENGYVFSTVHDASRRPDSDLSKTVVMTFDDGFESFHGIAGPLLAEYGCKATVFSVAGFTGKPSTWDTLPPQVHLSAAQLRDICDCGHEIGSHSMSHANLTFLSDADLECELAESKKVLEDIIGRPVTSISFPFGQWNRRVWDKARSIGYTAATSYACSKKEENGIVRLWGIYSFDSVDDVWNRAVQPSLLSNSIARGYVMPHFAKGTPMWKFRNNYAVMR
jgi:peptidoglycan/xylan/chitin deacetylase (PgdA/CDA1 family)